MPADSPQRFDTLAATYAVSEVHRHSPTLQHLHTLLPPPESVCDVACGAGHSGLSFADIAQRIVAVDPAPNMLTQTRRLAEERGVAIETVEARAEAIPLPSSTFDLVLCRMAAHHFTDLAQALGEMTRLAKPGGHVAIIDLEGDADPQIDALNHAIEMLHDPTHRRSYSAAQWRDAFTAAELEITTCATRWHEAPAGVTIQRWCELGNSGAAAQQAIETLLENAPPEHLAALDIARDADGQFRIPVRALLMVGRKAGGE